MSKPIIIKLKSYLELNVRYENEEGITSLKLEFPEEGIPAVLGASFPVKVTEVRRETVDKLNP